MSTITFTGTEILVGIGLVVFVIFAFLFYRLINEIILTLRQVRRAVREMERTIQNSQEIIYNAKSITRTLDSELKEVQGIVESARGAVEQLHSAVSTVTKPISQFRSLATGVAYAAKYLLKRRRSYDDEDE